MDRAAEAVSRSRLLVLGLALALAAAILSCDSDSGTPPAGQSPARFVAHRNDGCTGADSSGQSGPRCRLIGVAGDPDTLVLRIGFRANCCPHFVEDVEIGEGSLSIAVRDTLGICDCYCWFENDFVFADCEGETWTLHFETQERGGERTCAFDTLFAVPDGF